MSEAAIVTTPDSDPAPSNDPAPTALDGGDPSALSPAPTGDPVSWLDSAPDDWRNVLATNSEGVVDDSRLAQLGRVTNIPKLVDNYFAAQDKIRSGQIEAAAIPDEHSSDEEWATFRTEQGIPDKAEDYTIALDEGLVLGDDDQEILNQVYPVAHAANLPSTVVSQLTNAMLEGQAQQFHAMEIQQEGYRKEADAQVRSAWKGDYEVNKNLIVSTLINSLPEVVREDFAHATLADGRKVMNSPEMLIALADWARQMNPAATVVPNNANPMQAISNEIDELQARMGEDGWHKDKAAQDRYMQLIEARDNLSNR